MFATWMTHDSQAQRTRFAFVLMFFWLTCVGIGVIFFIDHWAYPLVGWLSSLEVAESGPLRSLRSRGFAISIVPMGIAMFIAIRASIKGPDYVGRKRGGYRDFWKIATFMVGPMVLVAVSKYSALGSVLAVLVNGAVLWVAYLWSLKSSVSTNGSGS